MKTRARINLPGIMTEKENGPLVNGSMVDECESNWDLTGMSDRCPHKTGSHSAGRRGSLASVYQRRSGTVVEWVVLREAAQFQGAITGHILGGSPRARKRLLLHDATLFQP